MSSPKTSRNLRRGRPPGGGWTTAEGRDVLVAAAERCLTRTGPEKLTMANVAAEAGVSPATLYRYFEGRDALLGSVLTASAIRITASAEEVVRDSESLGEFVVDGIVEIVRLMFDDSLLRAMFAGDERSAAGSAVARSQAVLDHGLTFAAGVFTTRPEFASELRWGVSIEEAVDHLMRVVLSLILTDSAIAHEPARLRRYLQAMVLPALLEIRPPLPPTSPSAL